MLVCICKGITDKDIENEIFDGASSFKEISRKLGIASDCGQCARYAEALVGDTIMQLQLGQGAALAYEIKC